MKEIILKEALEECNIIKAKAVSEQNYELAANMREIQVSNVEDIDVLRNFLIGMREDMSGYDSILPLLEKMN